MEKEQKKKRQILIPKREEDERRQEYFKHREIFIEKIKEIFKGRIGEQNAIGSWALFTEMFGSPHKYNIYKREFLWKMLKGIINNMRKNTNYFIICHSEMWFIPQTREEGKYYEDRLNSEITGLKESIKRLKVYIRNKEWKSIGGEK
jgi:hypothetical protein